MQLSFYRKLLLTVAAIDVILATAAEMGLNCNADAPPSNGLIAQCDKPIGGEVHWSEAVVITALGSATSSRPPNSQCQRKDQQQSHYNITIIDDGGIGYQLHMQLWAAHSDDGHWHIKYCHFGAQNEALTNCKCTCSPKSA